MRRRALSALLAIVVVALLAACGGGSNKGGTATPSPAVPTASETATPVVSAPTSVPATAPAGALACAAFQLSSTTERQGAAGHTLGGITFTNTSNETCTLRGRPDLLIEDSAGVDLATEHTPASFAPELAGDPNVTVTLVPGGQARVNFDWVGACVAALTSPEIISVVLPAGAGTLEADRQDVTGTCLGPAETSSVAIGAFIAAP